MNSESHALVDREPDLRAEAKSLSRHPVMSDHLHKVTDREPNNVFYGRGAQSFRISTNSLKILGVGRLIQIKFHVEEPQTLGSTVRNVIATAT